MNVLADEGDTFYACQNGKQLEEDYVDETIDQLEKEIFYKIIDEAAKMDEIENVEDRTIDDMINSYFDKFLNKMRSKQNLTNEQVEIIRSILFKYALEFYDCAPEDFNNWSVIGWHQYDDCRQVLTQLIEYLSSKISAEKIFFNEAVKKIEWGNDKTHVIITTINQNSKKESIYECLQCICTIPLGCLKERHKELFEPNLTPPKINAITNLGFSVVNKVFLFFENHPFEVT